MHFLNMQERILGKEKSLLRGVGEHQLLSVPNTGRRKTRQDFVLRSGQQLVRLLQSSLSSSFQ
jgi:hypothetical protein